MDAVLPPLHLNKPPIAMSRVVSRSVLVLLAVGLGFCSGFAFSHKCALGAKWFESNTFWLFAALFGVAVLWPKRLWLAAVILGALFVAVNYGLAPAYLALIHPNGEG